MKRALGIGLSLLVVVSIWGLSQSGFTILDSGTLVFSVGDQQLGVEVFSYQTLPTGEIVFISSVVIASGKGPLLQSQTMQLDNNLTPLSYQSHQRFPNGSERTIQASIDGTTANVIIQTEDGVREETLSAPHQLMIVDNNSPSQIIVPLLRMPQGPKSRLEFSELVPSNAAIESAVLVAQGKTLLRAAGTEFAADEFHLMEGERSLPIRLFSLDGRFIAGLQQAEDEPPVLFFRQDLYPQGLEVMP